MIENEYQRIAELEDTHWWYKSLHTLVLNHIKEHFNTSEINIIDAGCGTGGLMSFLKRNGYQNVEGFDLSNIALQICEQRAVPAFKGDLKDISNYYNHAHADVIISNDTLYFLDIAEQRSLTDNIYQLLRKNGLLIINLPSLKAFGGIHDLQVGIKKRFEPEDIWKIFDRGKYSLIAKIYWPFLLSPIIWILRCLQRLRMKFSTDFVIQSDLKTEGRIINSVLLSITKTENNILTRKPFGTSLFLVMKKNTF